MKVLKIEEVAARVALSKSTIYARIRSGVFPKPIALGERRRAWPEDEIDAWLESRRVEGWLETRPEMEAARLRAQARDGDLLESLEDHALGVKDEETGRWTGGNPTLLKFLAKSQLGMTETPKPEHDDDLSKKTPDQLNREATVLMRQIAARREALGLSAADVEYVDRDRDR